MNASQAAWRAAVETNIMGKLILVPVFPRSRKRTTFPTLAAAVTAIERTRAIGRGYVYQGEFNPATAYTIAL